jgi:hypothetical protein
MGGDVTSSAFQIALIPGPSPSGRREIRKSYPKAR